MFVLVLTCLIDVTKSNLEKFSINNYSIELNITTRIGDTWGETGHLTEYQNKKGWLLNIQDFKDEATLITFLISSGELYFVNQNFIN